jgi:uncharacterized protein YjbI with pentapeptide repeats
LAGSRIARTQQELNAVLLAHERYLHQKAGGTLAQLSAMDLSRLNFAQRNLRGADLSGSTLVSATLARADFERANLYCADLRLADLRHANLRHADLRGTSLRGANLSCAILDNADLRSASMAGASAQSTYVAIDSSNGGGGVDFTNCSMKRASLTGANLKGVNFNGALLQGAIFKGAKLADVTFRGAVLTGVNLRDLDVPASALEGAITEPSAEAAAHAMDLKPRLDVHQLWIRTGGKEGAPAVLDGEDLRPLQSFFAGRHLTGLSARNAIAIGVNFSGCQLQGARFEGADLRDADFSEADLRAASFRGALLAHARFARANLLPLTLKDGRQTRVDLTAAVGQIDQFASAKLADDVETLGLATEKSAAA